LNVSKHKEEVLSTQLESSIGRKVGEYLDFVFREQRNGLAKVVSKMQLIVKIVSIIYQNDLFVTG
jgi:hypothetical protein